MKKFQSSLVCLITSTAFMTAHANPIHINICSQLPGFWHGETHLKNQADCLTYNGCTHVVTGTIERTSNHKYFGRFTYTDGTQVKTQGLNMACEYRNITIPNPLKYTINADCDSTNHCFIVYDDARFSAEWIKG